MTAEYGTVFRTPLRLSSSRTRTACPGRSREDEAALTYSPRPVVDTPRGAAAAMVAFVAATPGAARMRTAEPERAPASSRLRTGTRIHISPAASVPRTSPRTTSRRPICIACTGATWRPMRSAAAFETTIWLSSEPFTSLTCAGGVVCSFACAAYPHPAADRTVVRRRAALVRWTLRIVSPPSVFRLSSASGVMLGLPACAEAPVHDRNEDGSMQRRRDQSTQHDDRDRPRILLARDRPGDDQRQEQQCSPHRGQQDGRHILRGDGGDGFTASAAFVPPHKPQAVARRDGQQRSEGQERRQ